PVSFLTPQSFFRNQLVASRMASTQKNISVIESEGTVIINPDILDASNEDFVAFSSIASRMAARDREIRRLGELSNQPVNRLETIMGQHVTHPETLFDRQISRLNTLFDQQISQVKSVFDQHVSHLEGLLDDQRLVRVEDKIERVQEKVGDVQEEINAKLNQTINMVENILSRPDISLRLRQASKSVVRENRPTKSDLVGAISEVATQGTAEDKSQVEGVAPTYTVPAATTRTPTTESYSAKDKSVIDTTSLSKIPARPAQIAARRRLSMTAASSSAPMIEAFSPRKNLQPTILRHPGNPRRSLGAIKAVSGRRADAIGADKSCSPQLQPLDRSTNGRLPVATAVRTKKVPVRFSN
ncbi:MAG: hypothetical protein LQ341_004625, partial [Variospora aurantia]